MKNLNKLTMLLGLIILIGMGCKTSRQDATDSPTKMIKEDVVYLASDALTGREIGTDGEMAAGAYIADRFKRLGIQPMGENGTFFQTLSVDKKKANPHGVEFSDTKDNAITGRNVIGYIDNNSPYTVVIGAHYDHLGMGQEGSLHAGEPAIHNGADDNASGTAALMKLAADMRNAKLKNNVLFIAFTGEEKGLWGSNYFVKNPTIDLSSVNFMINMDMVGRLESDRGLIINAVGTSPVWKPTIDKLNKDRFNISTSESGVGPSDHTSFYLMDLPVLHFFTGAHEDYHKPGDDFDKVDYQGILDIKNFIQELVMELDDDKITFTKTKEEEQASRADFKVTLGVIPDYIFDGEGMRIDGVREGRTADAAGMKKGDIVVQLGEAKIKDMMSYMEALALFEEGQTVPIKYIREGKEIESAVTFK
jgi:Zn-dependent M28 family amino/carboxypeptidase